MNSNLAFLKGKFLKEAVDKYFKSRGESYKKSIGCVSSTNSGSILMTVS